MSIKSRPGSGNRYVEADTLLERLLEIEDAVRSAPGAPYTKKDLVEAKEEEPFPWPAFLCGCLYGGALGLLLGVMVGLAWLSV